MTNFAKVLVAVAFLLFVMSIGYWVATSTSSEDYLRLSDSAETLRADNAELHARNARLQSRIDALRNDSRAIERRIRDDLGMIRRDEILILLDRPGLESN